MALSLLPKYHDRVKVYSTSTGTGSFAIDSVASGFNALPAADYFYYVIEHENGTEWEIGFASSPVVGTLTRENIVASSNAGANVNFTAGSKTVYTTAPASLFNAVRDVLESLDTSPIGKGAATVNSASPTAVSITYVPGLHDVGGIKILIGTYTVTAYSDSEIVVKAWRGNIVIVNDVVQADTPVVVADPGSKTWSYTVDSAGTFTVTGEAELDISWSISVSVSDHAEKGA